jgi:plastocyanin
MFIVARIGIGRILIVLALLTLALAGRAAQAAPSRQTAAVKVVDFGFEPKNLTVAAGTTITWTNTGQRPHTATSTTAGVFDTGRIDPGASKSATLNTAGTFNYVCQFHENMVGQIVVTAAQAQPAPAPNTPAAPAAPSGSLTAKNQAVSGDSITVQQVQSSVDGWIAVHMDDAGKPGKVVGFAPVKAGASSNVRVTLNPAPKAGDKFWPMLHVDVGEKGKYEFPGADAPVVANGMPVMMEITMLAGASTALPATGAGSGLIPLLAGIALLALLGGLAFTRILRRRTSLQ